MGFKYLEVFFLLYLWNKKKKEVNMRGMSSLNGMVGLRVMVA